MIGLSYPGTEIGVGPEISIWSTSISDIAERKAHDQLTNASFR